MKILSICGGGIKGAIPAMFLAALEGKVGPLYKVFDLIAGTSTGGILAIGLALGIPASTLAGFYPIQGPEIFKRRWTSYFGIHDSKYDVVNLQKILDKAFEGKRFSDVKTRVMVTSSNLKTLNGTFFNSWTNGNLLASVAGTCTSAAPTYFDPFHSMADGGLFANDPSLFALVQASTLVPTQPIDVHQLLDLKCPPPTVGAISGIGLAGFAPHAIDIFMDTGMNTMAESCEQLLGNNFLQLIPSPGKASHAMDNVSPKNLKALTDAGHEFAAWAVPEAEKFLLADIATPIQETNVLVKDLHEQVLK